MVDAEAEVPQLRSDNLRLHQQLAEVAGAQQIARGAQVELPTALARICYLEVQMPILRGALTQIEAAWQRFDGASKDETAPYHRGNAGSARQPPPRHLRSDTFEAELSIARMAVREYRPPILIGDHPNYTKDPIHFMERRATDVVERFRPMWRKIYDVHDTAKKNLEVAILEAEKEISALRQSIIDKYDGRKLDAARPS